MAFGAALLHRMGQKWTPYRYCLSDFKGWLAGAVRSVVWDPGSPYPVIWWTSHDDRKTLLRRLSTHKVMLSDAFDRQYSEQKLSSK